MINLTINKICKFSILSVGIISLVACGENQNKNSKIEAKSIESIHENILTIDSHVDISPDYTLSPKYDPGQLSKMKVDLPKMKAGGLDAVFFVVYVGQTQRTEENYAAAKKLGKETLLVP